ncbi:MAG: LysR family transcriptional regulator [Vicinamibacterales bacterium]
MPLALEIRHLTLVDAVAELGNVTRAADRLHLTQSALSHQLRDIESRLGAPLFTRLSRRMALTPEGDRVLAAARRVLDELKRTEEDVRGMHDAGRGVLRLATQCNTGYHWLPALLAGFHRKHPGVEVEIVVGATGRPIAALREGEIDLAVITEDDVDDPRIVVRPLFVDELVALVSPQHRFAKRAWISAEDLEDEHLFMYRVDRKSSELFTRILTPAGIEPARVSQVPLTEAIVEMIKAGLGVGVLARWAVEPAIAAGTATAVRITRRGVRRQWSAATLANRPDPKWLSEFIRLLSTPPLPANAKGA